MPRNYFDYDGHDDNKWNDNDDNKRKDRILPDDTADKDKAGTDGLASTGGQVSESVPVEFRTTDMDKMMEFFCTNRPSLQCKALLASAFDIIVKNEQQKLISAKSLQEAARKLKVPVTDDEIQEWILAADEDENGEIDMQEFVELMCTSVHRDEIEHELKQTFKVFDKDESGTISCSELCGIIREFDQELTDQEAQDMVAVADINKSGTIDLDELVQILLSPDEEPDFSI